MKYNKILIYYFSGTGNAKFAAESIAQRVKKNGYEAEINNIADKKHNFSEINNECLIGFCFPTHGFNAPPIVLKFIKNFPKGNSNVFILNTRAGMKVFNLHTPGISGIAQLLPAIILWMKGYKTVGFRPLDMPSNWISIHPAFSSKAVNFMTDRCIKTLKRFTDKILNKKKVFNGLYSLPLDLILLPISIAYYLYGRFAIAKTFYANYNCTNCGLCIRKCPVNAIKEKSNRPYWTFDCESCMKCMNSCPKRAIETSHGFTFLLWWTVFSLMPVSFSKLLLEFDIITEKFYTENYDLLINGSVLVFGLILIFFGYKILHQALRINFLNKIISYTSLTHYKFWKRYKRK